jgi:hypothetical protein
LIYLLSLFTQKTAAGRPVGTSATDGKENPGFLYSRKKGLKVAWSPLFWGKESGLKFKINFDRIIVGCLTFEITYSLIFLAPQ